MARGDFLKAREVGGGLTCGKVHQRGVGTSRTCQLYNPLRAHYIRLSNKERRGFRKGFGYEGKRKGRKKDKSSPRRATRSGRAY